MSQYYLKVSDLYKLNIGSGYNMSIGSDGSSIYALKRWDGAKWVLVYQIKDGTGTVGRVMVFNGTGWVRASLK